MTIDGVPVTLVQNVRDLGIYIDGDLSVRRTFSERLRAVLLLSASYVRSIDRYQRPHSRH